MSFAHDIGHAPRAKNRSSSGDRSSETRVEALLQRALRATASASRLVRPAGPAVTLYSFDSGFTIAAGDGTASLIRDGGGVVWSIDVRTFAGGPTLSTVPAGIVNPSPASIPPPAAARLRPRRSRKRSSPPRVTAAPLGPSLRRVIC
jgi:hypothetical protein